MKGLKIRVPDVPAYTATPRACGANPTPIAFAEVYLALQNGTVDAQENPLPTIEAKKFYEVQKNISLTGHIIDSLILPKVMDEILAHRGQFNIRQIRVGQEQSDPSYARIEVSAETAEQLEEIIARLRQHGERKWPRRTAPFGDCPPTALPGGVPPRG